MTAGAPSSAEDDVAEELTADPGRVADDIDESSAEPGGETAGRGEVSRRRPWPTIAIVATLTALAASVRVGGLAPSSLFLDDAWVAYVRKASYSDVDMMGLTAPGFLAVQKFWFSIVGFSELRAQALPFLASVATPGVAYLTLRRSIRPELAAAAGVIVAFTALNAKYSFHVKQYTIEVLAGFILFFLAWRWATAPSNRRLLALVAMICASATLSFVTIILATGPIALVAWRALRLGVRQIAETAAILGAAAIFLGGWYFGVIKPNASDELETFWGDFYLETGGSILDLIASLRDRVWGLFESLSPFPPWMVAVVMTITFLAAIVYRTDWAVMATVPLLAAAVLAGMQRAPLGGGRTDNYLLVPLVVGFIVGVDAIVSVAAERWGPRMSIEHPARAMSFTAAALIAGLSIGGYEPLEPYPQEDIRPLIESLEARSEPDDVVLLYYASTYAYGLYADVESEPIDFGTPYWVEFSEPNLVVQRSQRTSPDRYAQYAEQALAQSDRIWLLASHLCACDWGEINRQLRVDFGLRVDYAEERPGASLQLWVRDTDA